MGKRAGKAGVYLAILVVIIVVVIFLTTRGGGEVEEGPVIQTISGSVSGSTYPEWTAYLAQKIADQPEGADKTGPLSVIVTVDQSTGQNRTIDPFSGEGIYVAGYVVSGSVDRLGNWTLTLDVDEPGTSDDGAEVTAIVPQRFASGDMPAEGTRIECVGALRAWVYEAGKSTKVTLKDATITKRQ